MKELYLILIHTMKKRLKLLLLLLAATLPLKAQDVIVKGPDGNLQVAVTCIGGGKVVYSVSYKDKQMLENSPLGMETNVVFSGKAKPVFSFITRTLPVSPWRNKV